MTENEISKVVVEAAIEVHRTLGGPGLLERSPSSPPPRSRAISSVCGPMD